MNCIAVGEIILVGRNDVAPLVAVFGRVERLFLKSHWHGGDAESRWAP